MARSNSSVLHRISHVDSGITELFIGNDRTAFASFFRDLSVSCTGDFWRDFNNVRLSYGVVEVKLKFNRYLVQW